MLTLFKSKKFQEDYVRYQQIISEMPSGPIQDEASKLLSNLVHVIKQLDQNISEIAMSNHLASPVSDLRSNITQIRKQLEEKINDWSEIKSKQL